MNSSFLEDFKNAWGKPNNALAQLILINVIIFLVLITINVFSTIFKFDYLFEIIHKFFSVPPRLEDLIFRPWTILTYSFAHDHYNIWHIFFNMLFLYWFGRLIVEYLGSQKLIGLYVIGALAGSIAYIISYNVIPYYSENANFSGMVGASASVNAVMAAAATLIPNYTFHLLLIGPVRIKYIVIFWIVVSFMGTIQSNAGGNIAHLGGAAIGYLYIRQLQSGTDIGNWVINWMTFVKSFFIKQSKIKVSHKTSRSTSHTATSSSRSGANVDQKEIDAILDKISKSGYESLSKSEKQRLFNASKK